MAHTQLDPHLVALTSPGSFAAEQYQGLRLTIERLRRGRTLQVIAVTSPAAGEGKTLTAINLAGALARGGDDARVLLIDADLRRPAVARQLAIDRRRERTRGSRRERGGDDRQRHAEAEAVQPVRHHGRVRGAARCITSCARRVSSVVLAEARQRYDFVVLDTPPLLPVFDSALLANAVDGVLMVVAANQTPRKLLGEALNLLDPAKVLGIVFNRDAKPMFGYYDAYYKDYFPEQAVATEPKQNPGTTHGRQTSSTCATKSRSRPDSRVRPAGLDADRGDRVRRRTRATSSRHVDDPDPRGAGSADHTRWLGPCDALAEIVERVHPAFIIVALADRRDRLPLQTLLERAGARHRRRGRARLLRAPDGQAGHRGDQAEHADPREGVQEPRRRRT